MPALALGGEKSLGTGEADTLRFVATNVTMGIVPGSGHWIMDENPKATTALIVNFLAK
jgi:pimeloyl-ACP methyl ester carboxylesterase